MIDETSDQLFEEVAATTIGRIRQDRQRVPVPLRPFLIYLEAHLFDSGLDVRHALRRSGLRDHFATVEMRSALGRTPHGYIESRRMETACLLLEKTSLRVWQISEHIGYSSIQVFSRAFLRWAGMRPTEYRRQKGTVEVEHPPRPSVPRPAEGDWRDAPQVDELLQEEALRQALLGELEPEKAEVLLQHLLELYPRRRRAQGFFRERGERRLRSLRDVGPRRL